jgi:hypothetical protein
MGIKKNRDNIRFEQRVKQVKVFKRKAPVVIANQSLNHFLLGFERAGFQTNDSRGGWPKRKSNAKRNVGRALLVDSGALRNSLQKIKTSFEDITIGTRRIQYARRHNEGLTDRLGRKMPKRNFIGESNKLNKNNIQTLLKMIDKIFSK